MGNTLFTPADQTRWQVPSYLRRRNLPRVPATDFLARPPAANDPGATSWQQQARARAAARQLAHVQHAPHSGPAREVQS